MPKFFQSEIAAYGGEKTTFKNVKFKKNSLENSGPAVAGTILEFIPVHIKNPPVIQFIAYINSMSDRFDTQFSSEQPYGRTDAYHVWKSSKRSIDLNWVLPSSSTAMALNNMNNLSWLLGALYPTYKDTTTATSIAASPLFRVRHANLISSPVRDGMGLLCVLNGVNVTHEVKDGFIHVNPKNMGSNFANVEGRLIKQAGFENSIREGKKLLIPKTISLQTTLNVVHDHALGWDLDTGNFRGGGSGFPYQIGLMRDGDTNDPPSTPSSAYEPTPGRNSRGELEAQKASASVFDAQGVGQPKDGPRDSFSVPSAAQPSPAGSGGGK